MVIRKIINIKNLGKFRDYRVDSQYWNGVLNKVTAIYADNGSGKTTFTQIFKSLKGEDLDLFCQRQSFDCLDEIDIKLLNGDNKQISFQHNVWSNSIENIEVFDAYFVESNVYIINLGNYILPNSLFWIIVGSNTVTAYNKLMNLIQQRKKLSKRRRNIKSQQRKLHDEKQKTKLTKKINRLSQKIQEFDDAIRVGKKELSAETELSGKKYLDKINEYLGLLSPELKISKLNQKLDMFVYHITIDNHNVRTDEESKSLSRTLSEGEKNALAFAFFLAKLDLDPDIDKKLIVFDDPITSLDSNRRNVTISILSDFAKRSNQFILLSHDINFVKDFIEINSYFDILNLKILYDGNTSKIIKHNIEDETLTGLFKDIKVLNNYAEKGEASEYDKRYAIRCIRPVIEGFFRIKFYYHINKSQWLGDIIEMIQNSNEGDCLLQEKENLFDLCDINNYTRGYHHSDPNHIEKPINSEQLKTYCKRTLKLLEKL